jgi:signal peptide peptidase SppA
MKQLYKKINDTWLRLRGWSETSIIGFLLGGIFKIILIVIVLVGIYYAVSTTGAFKDNSSVDSSVSDSSDTANDNCTVRGIELHGTMLTYIPKHSETDTYFNYDVVASQDVDWTIKQANDDERIKAIVVEVDSPGGSPVAGSEIADAIKSSKKPVVAFIREMGASSAYWAISSASKIFASLNSNVGGIGVTSSYLSNVGKNTKDGYIYEQLSAGKFKDSGSTDKPLTAEEKVLFMRDINIVYENFIAVISQNRKITTDKVRGYADGATVMGATAKKMGLIDEIGGLPEVEQYLEKTMGEKPEICW